MPVNGHDTAGLTDSRTGVDADPMADIVGVDIDRTVVLIALERPDHTDGVRSRLHHGLASSQRISVGIAIQGNGLSVTVLVAAATDLVVRHQEHLLIVVHMPEEGRAPSGRVLLPIQNPPPPSSAPLAPQ